MKEKKIGVVGLGVGSAFFNAIKDTPGAKLGAICDVDAAKLHKVGKEQGIAAAFTRFEDMLRTDIDLVVIATPIQVHGSQALAAMRAGKHVLCEYVAAMDPAEGEELIRASRETKTKYMFIETDCYERKNMVMAELARRGVLGDLTMGRGHYIHDCKRLARNPDGTLTWRGELYMEGGCRSSAVHNAMPLLELFGERVTEVYSYGPGPRTVPEFRMNDRVTTAARLRSGRVLEFVSDFLSWHPVVCGYCLQGTKGCFEFDRAALVEGGKLSAWKDLDAIEKEFNLGAVIRDSAGHGSAFAACLKAFLAAIDTDARPRQDLFDALHITAIGWAATESIRTGRPAKVLQFD